MPGYSDAGPEEPVKVTDRVLAGFGWQRDDVKLVQQMASNGSEPVGSLGYDGPLAALSPERQNLADYFKETVAVVTNPAIDREREMEHFSTRTVFGRRPSIDAAGEDTGTVETAFPVILGGHHDLAPLSDKTYRQIAREHHTYLLEDLWEEFRGRADAVDISLLESETTRGAIERIKQEAVKKVRDGAELLVLTDRTVYDAERRYLDPHLATSAVDQALKQFKVEPGEENLRRRCGIVLRSAAIRNVHDTMLALGLGANGVCPYTMVEVICVEDYETDVSNLCDALAKGIEKVISTIGIHEVRGYARQFSSIGVKPELAEIFQTEAFAASESGGVGFADLDEDSNERARILAGDEEAKPAKTFRFYPKVYKAAIATANGSGTYEEYSREGARPGGAEPDLDAPHHGPEGRPGAGRRRAGRRRRRRPPRLPGRDLLDELRLAVRAGLPRLRRGGEVDQRPLRQRRGRRDPRHVRATTASGAASRSPRAASASRRRCSTPPTSPRSRSARAPSPARAATCPARRSPRRSPPPVTRRPAPT